MPTYLLDGPSAEPLALAEAKAFLRLEHDDDDDLVVALITAARIHVEADTRRALITQSWRIVRDAWPGEGRLVALPAPVRDVIAARVYDGVAVAHAIDTQAFVIDRAASVISFAPWSLAMPGRAFSGIEIDVTCGYGDTAGDVPAPLRQAIRLLVAQWYENRGIAVAQTLSTLPAGVAALVAPFRMLLL